MLIIIIVPSVAPFPDLSKPGGEENGALDARQLRFGKWCYPIQHIR